MSKIEPKYIVRLYDMFDGWMDVFGPATRQECEDQWLIKTSNGTRLTQYSDGDYYKVFPADTRMLYTPEFLGR